MRAESEAESEAVPLVVTNQSEAGRGPRLSPHYTFITLLCSTLHYTTFECGAVYCMVYHRLVSPCGTSKYLP